MRNNVAVLVKVDAKTKEKMRQMNINWSKEIRKFINERVGKQGNLALAVALTDRIFNLHKKSGSDSTEIIRKFRDERYGPNSR